MVPFLVIASIVMLSIFFPEFRIFAIVLSVILVVIVISLFYYDNNRQQVSKTLIKISDIEIQDLVLHSSSGGSGLGNFVPQTVSYSLSGEVKNNSKYDLGSVTLELLAYDCVSDFIDQSCQTIGDTKVPLFAGAPPNQIRSISSSYVSFDNMPSVKNNFLWKYEVSEITAN